MPMTLPMEVKRRLPPLWSNQMKAAPTAWGALWLGIRAFPYELSRRIGVVRRVDIFEDVKYCATAMNVYRHWVVPDIFVNSANDLKGIPLKVSIARPDSSPSSTASVRVAWSEGLSRSEAAGNAVA